MNVPRRTWRGRTYLGVAGVHQHLSSAGSLPLLVRTHPAPDQEDASSLNNILDAVPGLEVPDEDNTVPSPLTRRIPPPPPQRISTLHNDHYYCKPFPPLDAQPALRRIVPRRPANNLHDELLLPAPPCLPDQFDEEEYRENRRLRRRSQHLESDVASIQEEHKICPPARAFRTDQRHQRPRTRALPVRSQSLRLPRPLPCVVTRSPRRESPVRLCTSRKNREDEFSEDSSPSPCRTDPACWTPPPPPTSESPLEPFPPIDLAVGGESVGRVRRFLRAFYRELGSRDPPHPPPWMHTLPAEAIAPQRMDPALTIINGELRLDIRLEQILASVKNPDGSVLESPRRVLVEGGPAMGKTTLSLKLLSAWADGVPWIPPDVTLAFLVPLRELRGNSLSAYLGKQLLPKSALPASFDKVWRTLLSLEERLLFVLDGYDEAVRGYPGVPGGREALGDALDLLEGRILKESRVIVTCSTGWAHELSPYTQRRLLLGGLQWTQVESLTKTFFSDESLSQRFLATVTSSPSLLQPMCRAPLGWQALCALFQDNRDLPDDSLVLHQALFRCIARRSLSSRNQSITMAMPDVPPHSRKVLADLGRLALIAMRDDRLMYTDNELRMHCGSAAAVASLGFLCRGLNFGRTPTSRRTVEFYTPLFRSLAEFLAAYYMASVASYSNILRRDLTLLPGLASGRVEGATDVVLRFLLGLLGRRGNLVLSQLSPLDATPRMVFSLLRAAGTSEANVEAVCRLLGACGAGCGSGADSSVPQAVVHCTELELEGWAAVLRAPCCSLGSLELLVSADGDTRLEPLFAALAANMSIRCVRISALLGNELSAHQLHRLAKHIHSALARSRTQALELVVACMEDNAHDRFQCLVDAVCTGLRSPECSLNRLLLDVNLNSSQLQQVLSCLRGGGVRTLQLPHLGCGAAGLRTLATHLRCTPVDALSLVGSWGARTHGASENGGSVGSGGSGPAGLGSCFSSLPRGALGLHGSLSRPATLPRQPLAAHILGASDSGYGSSDNKRGSDSLLWRGQAVGALPVCDVAAHSGSGFHDVFESIRDPNCQLRNLNVSKCLLSAGDAVCLGATVRSGELTALRVEGTARLGEVLPSLLALAADPPLQLLDASSPRLSLPDGPAQLVCAALAKNTNLRLLSLDGWTFRLEEDATLSCIASMLSRTGIRDLSLSGCRVHAALVGDAGVSRVASGRSDGEIRAALVSALSSAPALLCPELIFLRLAGLQVWVRERIALRGPQLLPVLRSLTSLRELDLSAAREDANATTPGQPGPLVVDDKALISFWLGVSESLHSLQTLHIAYWRLRLEDPERTLRATVKAMRGSALVNLRADGLIACDANRQPLEHAVLQTATTGLCCLRRLGLCGVSLAPSHAATLGRHVRDRLAGPSLSLLVNQVPSQAVAALVSALEEGSKIEVTFLAGPNAQLRAVRVANSGKSRRFRRFASLRD